MTKASWKKSEAQTKLTREVVRINTSIVNNNYSKEYGGLLNPRSYYTFKYAVESYRVMTYVEETGEFFISVTCNNYSVRYLFTEITAQLYEHTDGRRFTRIFIYNDKHKVVGSVDIPEHRRV